MVRETKKPHLGDLLGEGIDRDNVPLGLLLRILEEDVEGEDLVPKSFLEEEGEVEC